MRVERNVVFANPGGLPLAADFYLPQGSEDKPLVMFCHGGGWISGDRTMYADEAEWLAHHGIPSATVSYRLAPLHVFPACVADLQDFVAFARGAGAKLGYDGTRIYSVGNSAGGHLSAMLALCDEYLGDQKGTEGFKVDAAVAICPITDITQPRQRHFPISWSFVEQFMGSLDLDESLFAKASPISHASKCDAPMLLVHGADDDIVPVEQSETLYEALKAAGSRVELCVLPNEMHSFSYTGWMQIREMYWRFIQAQMTAEVVP